MISCSAGSVHQHHAQASHGHIHEALHAKLFAVLSKEAPRTQMRPLVFLKNQGCARPEVPSEGARVHRPPQVQFRGSLIVNVNLLPRQHKFQASSERILLQRKAPDVVDQPPHKKKRNLKCTCIGISLPLLSASQKTLILIHPHTQERSNHTRRRHVLTTGS